VDVKEEVTPEWIRSHIPYTVFRADKENYARIADVMEKLLDELNKLRSNETPTSR
jgi:hypothetical protein